MHLTFTGVEGLELSPSVAILLEHPEIFRQNVANKNDNINFFK